MKRITALFLAILISLSTVSAVSEENYEDALDYIFADSQKLDYEHITRLDCFVAIMRIIGFNERTAYTYTHLTSYDENPYLDVGGSGYGYVIAGDFPYNITNGVAHRYFAPYRNVTIKECLAFMLRCLEDDKNVLWENTIEDSVSHGLISVEEAEEYGENKLLDKKLFHELLCRFLKQNRALYCEMDESGNDEVKHADGTDMTYLDWVRKCKEKGLPSKPWPAMKNDASEYEPIEVYSCPEGYVPMEKLEEIGKVWFFESGIWVYKELHKDVVYQTVVENYNFIVKYNGQYYINEEKYNAIAKELTSGKTPETLRFADDWEWAEE